MIFIIKRGGYQNNKIMYKNRIKILLLAINIMVVLSGDVCPKNNDVNKMQEIYFYARKYFDEGKYDKAIVEFTRIIELSPEHQESLRMIDVCDKKKKLTENLLNEAIALYNRGSLSASLNILEQAHAKDNIRYEINTLMAKILTELGMEYSIVGNYEKSLNYFKRAQLFAPADPTILDLINIGAQMLEASLLESDTYEEEKTVPADMGKMTEAFNKYHEQQKKILSEYDKTLAHLKEVVDASRQIKRFDMSRAGMFIKKNSAYFLIFILVFSAVMFFIFKAISRSKKSKIVNEKVFQEKMLISFDKISKVYDKQTPEFDKKIKKLNIIEVELTGDNKMENKIAEHMLESYFNDINYKVRLKAIQILHKVDPERAVQIIEDIIKREKGEIMLEAIKLLGEISSDYSLELLLKLTEYKKDDIKKTALTSIVKILNTAITTDDMKKKINKKLKDIYSDGDWIVV